MKKFLLLCTVFASAAFISGCTSVISSDGASGIPQFESDHPGYAAKFTHQNTRVEGKAQINVLFGIFAWGAEGFADNCRLSTFAILSPSENLAKNSAVFNACMRNKADTLLGTRFVMTITNYFVFKTINCKVAGFPAIMSGVVEKKPYVLYGGKLVWLGEAPVPVCPEKK